MKKTIQQREHTAKERQMQMVMPLEVGMRIGADDSVQTLLKATMHINRKPGEIMEVDWAGQTVELCDSETGEILTAYVFVAVLPYSGYAEAFSSQNQAAWTAAHVNAYEYFGGVARILVPDNLKTGVVKHTRNEIILNKSYQELAEHYGTAILPTRSARQRTKQAWKVRLEMSPAMFWRQSEIRDFLPYGK